MNKYAADRMRTVQQLWRVEDLEEHLLLTMQQSVYTEWWLDIERYAQRALSEPLPVLRFELFRQFEDDGQRIPYEQIYFERRGRSGALALMLLRLQAEHRYKVTSNQDGGNVNQAQYQHEGMAYRAEHHCEGSTYRADDQQGGRGSTNNKAIIRNDEELKREMRLEPAQVWNRHEVLTALEEAIWELCGEYTWCLPAHLSSGTHTPAWQEIDLFTAETAGMLAELSILLDGVIDKRVIERMRLEIRRRVLDVLVEGERHFGWETAEHNWSAVCASGCGIAALLVEQHDGRKQLILKRVLNALEYFLQGYGDDGGCAEGIGYWVYGFGYFTYLIDMLEATGYPVQLSEAQQRKIHAMANFPQAAHLSNGVFVNFSDSEERQTLPTGLLSRLAQRQGVDVSLPFKLALFSEDHCHRWAHVLRDLLWSEPERWAVDHAGIYDEETGDEQLCRAGTGEVSKLSKTSSTVSATVSRQVSIQNGVNTDCSLQGELRSDCDLEEGAPMQHNDGQQDRTNSAIANTDRHVITKSAYCACSDTNRDANKYMNNDANSDSHYWNELEWLVVRGRIGFAAKGGHNDEPHNHNDLGSFIIHGGGQNLLCDPGAGMYTQAYFAPGREAILHISSAGHSVPCINGMEQQSGRQQAAVVLDVQQRAQETLFELELAAAYPEAAGVASFTRRFHWQSLATADASTTMAQLDIHDRFIFQKCMAVNDIETKQATDETNIHIRERFMSRVEPQLNESSIIWQGQQALVRLHIEKGRYEIDVEELASQDHEGQPITLYRTNLILIMDTHKLSHAKDELSHTEEMNRSIVDKQVPDESLETESIAIEDITTLGTATLDEHIPILTKTRTQTRMNVSSTSLREGNKGKGRLLSTGIYIPFLIRRFLCETGVRPLIPSRSGVRPITKSLRAHPSKEHSKESNQEPNQDPNQDHSKEPSKERSKDHSEQPNVIKLDNRDHMSASNDGQQQYGIHCAFTFTIISQV